MNILEKKRKKFHFPSETFDLKTNCVNLSSSTFTNITAAKDSKDQKYHEVCGFYNVMIIISNIRYRAVTR